ncbi:Csu type fimbrial protein [Paraburkholderia sp. HP33-1]|uniref:Csu type fimbrial protein n=1 Tax=Paraburkholderia sp. HP33-1 TaxID=2883243 RepID=UPI001F1F08E0|nr:spore coat U domain-containing protein [Paraburkholderia sp. HP33-1]
MRVTSRKRLIVGLGTALIAALPLSRASAQSPATTTMVVTATVNANCTVSATDMAFGAYSGAQLDSTATITATCSNGTAYTVGLNQGLTGTGVTDRRMAGPGTDTLLYHLFSDTTRTTNWDDVGGANPATGTGTGSAQALTVYGRVPADQFVQAGNYSDTVTVTVSY